ncbi:MAG: UDP-glucose/GDP-mannose dehydrogenase family protein [Ignavibacteriaceae bacterium]|nr:UDP-glucose/GDP-mannose dehydrogenase family protein [Ignavibacteriaceae bacterium]
MKITVIGSGYVGLVTGTLLADVGNQVICIDNNPEKLNKLQNKIIPIFEPGLETYFLKNIEKERLTFSGDLQKGILESDVIFYCLPTPQGATGAADLQFVLSVAKETGKILRENNCSDFKVIVNKSTVPVGTAKKVIQIIQDEGVTNFAVVSNPEFLREGFAVEDFMKPDRIVCGSDNSHALDIMAQLYEPFVKQGNPIYKMDFESSELTKYASNSYLAMRITFMNELANLCEKVGANVDLVRTGMGSDTRIGKRFLFAGIGYGGSCFPKDVKALINTAEQFDVPLSVLKTVDAANAHQKKVLLKKIMKYYNGDIKNKVFAVWGLAFKPNTDDMRDAPSIDVINGLLEQGAIIRAYDPQAMENSKFYFGDKITYCDDEYEALKGAKALIIHTEWNDFRTPDFSKIENSLEDKVVFDGRNVFDSDKLEKTGLSYFSIGRKAILKR